MRPIHLRIPRFEGVRLWRASRLASWTIMPLLLTSTAPMVQAAQSVTDQTAQGVVLQVGKLGRWPGPARITRELSPIEVTIENRGGVPVLLTYARLQLVGKDGQPFRALPLFQVSASSTGEPVLTDPFPVMQLYFRTSGFRLAPTYAKVYPGVTVADKGIGLDPTYYGLYETIYSGKPLPTTEMRRRGLPEGVIDPGGRVEGFLFFEELPRSAKPAMLRYELVDAQTGQSIGTLQTALDD